MKILWGLKIYAMVPFKGSKIFEKVIISGLKFLPLCIRSISLRIVRHQKSNSVESVAKVIAQIVALNVKGIHKLCQKWS